jgi:predicted dehydrogenase
MSAPLPNYPNGFQVTIKKVWLIGSGGMAIDYAKVLTALQVPFLVIGRGAASAQAFTEKTGLLVIQGGLDAFLQTAPETPSAAIVAIGVESLAKEVRGLLANNVPRILVEKPGALIRSEIVDLLALADSKKAQVRIAYNRRFYSSTLRALELIAEDGGVQSMHFEFTEWDHAVRGVQTAPGVKEAWFIANSTHVVDLAFFLGGVPTEMQTFTSGGLDWHPNASVFAGAGRTDRGALFSYQANWGAPGRWGVEVITSNYRLIFRPMEALQIMRKASVKIEPVEIDDSLDKTFKPGLYVQVQRFLADQLADFCTLDDQIAHWDVYSSMAGYPLAPRQTAGTLDK